MKSSVFFGPRQQCCCWPCRRKPPAFAALDKDKSGSITAEEVVVVPGLTARLTQLDVNTDSKLSEEEYAALAA